MAVNHLDDPDGAAAVVDAIGRRGSDGFAVDADVSDPDAVAQMFESLDRPWNSLDIVVCNAGIDGPRTMAWESDVDAWKKVIGVDLVGSFLCARSALQRMVPQGRGTIVFISSVHEVIPWSGDSAYTASKAAVSMLSKTLAQEAAPHGVRVLAVAPGAVATAINASARDTDAELTTCSPRSR